MALQNALESTIFKSRSFGLAENARPEDDNNLTGDFPAVPGNHGVPGNHDDSGVSGDRFWADNRRSINFRAAFLVSRYSDG